MPTTILQIADRTEKTMQRASLSAYWWSPLRSPRNLYPEITANPVLWARLGLRTGRPFLNFGDELSRLAIEHATGRSVRWAPSDRADLIGIGSIMEIFMKRPGHALVWGTGVREPKPTHASRVEELGKDRFLAVRGPRSRDALGLDGSTVLGDAGLLAARLVPSSTQKRGKIFLPHFRSWHTAEGRGEIAKMAAHGFRVVEPTRKPLDVVRQISSAEFVASSSLHGVIVAHSVGTAVQHVHSGEHNSEPSFKYEDYFASMSLPFADVSLSALAEDEPTIRERQHSEVTAAIERAARLSDELVSTLRAGLL